MVLGIAVAVPILSPSDAAAAVRRFAVIVGSNVAPRAKQLTPLRFADDDAVNNYALLTLLGVEAVLVTTLDPESENLHRSHATALARRPATRANLASAIAEMQEKVEAANRLAGTEVEFIFWFSGHGGTSDDGQQGALFLPDGEFSRKDLHEMIARSKADYNHLVIDACNAYYVINAKGEALSRQELLSAGAEELLQAEFQSQFPTTAAVYASSRSGHTYEVEPFGGVFSYQLRSALAGAADVNYDGKITYSEISAFVNAASAEARPEGLDAKIKVYQAAQDRTHSLIDYDAASAGILLIDSADAGQGHVEHRGMRVLDLHKTAEVPVQLHLQPGREFTLTWDGREHTVVPERGKVIPLGELPRTSSRARTPRAGDLKHGLFRRAFGRNYYRAQCDVAKSDLVCEEEPAHPLPELRPGQELWDTPSDGSTERTLGVVLSGVGTAGLAAGAVLGVRTLQLVDDSNEYCDPSGRYCDPEGLALRSRARDTQTLGIGFAAAGGAILAGGLILHFTAPAGTQANQAALSLAFGSDGVTGGARLSW